MEIFGYCIFLNSLVCGGVILEIYKPEAALGVWIILVLMLVFGGIHKKKVE